MVRNILIITILVPLALSFFAPKRELYYLLEEKLQENNVIIADEEIDLGLFGLDIRHPKIYVSRIPAATADNIDIWSIALFSASSVNGLKVMEGFPQEVTVDELDITNLIFTPFELSLSGTSSLGELNGSANLNEGHVRLNLGATKVPMALTSFFKKGEEGLYYESGF